MDSNEKIAAFTQILAQDPGNAFARYGLAMERMQSGDTGQALAEFDALVNQHRDYVPGYHMAGQLLLREGDAAAARDWLARGLAAATRTGNQHAQNEIAALLDEASF